MSNNYTYMSCQVDNLLEVMLEDKSASARVCAQSSGDWAEYDVTIHSVDPVLRGLFARVVWGFLKELARRGIDLREAVEEANRRSLGGELYLTWAELGVGFFDHGTPLGNQLHSAAKAVLPCEQFFDSLGCSPVPSVDIDLVSSAIDSFLNLRKSDDELQAEIQTLKRYANESPDVGDVVGWWLDSASLQQMLISYPRHLLVDALLT